MTQKLAVVIPYYKRQFFRETLESLVIQTNKNFKVYIGNDSSPEDPSEILKYLEKDLKFTYKYFPENLGRNFLTKHWARCIDMVEDEDWIMLLCDDDLLAANVIEDFYNHYEDITLEEAHVINFATQVIDENGTLISNMFEHPRVQGYSDYFYNRFYNGSRSSLSEHIFSRERYKKYGFRNLPLAWHSDDLAWLEFSEFGKIYSINTAKVYFRLSKINISRPNYLVLEKEKYKYLFFTIIIKEYLSKFEKAHIRKILLGYEMMTYKLERNSFYFWINFLPKIFKYNGFIEGLKFTRRTIINYKRHGERGVHYYS